MRKLKLLGSAMLLAVMLLAAGCGAKENEESPAAGASNVTAAADEKEAGKNDGSDEKKDEKSEPDESEKDEEGKDEEKTDESGGKEDDAKDKPEEKEDKDSQENKVPEGMIKYTLKDMTYYLPEEFGELTTYEEDDTGIIFYHKKSAEAT